MQSETNYSIEIIRYIIPQGEHTHFETAYIAAGEHLKVSACCLGYQVIKGNEEPDYYIVIIHWTSKEKHLNDFRKSEEFKSFFKLVKPFYNNIQEMKHYNPTPNTWTKEQYENGFVTGSHS